MNDDQEIDAYLEEMLDNIVLENGAEYYEQLGATEESLATNS